MKRLLSVFFVISVVLFSAFSENLSYIYKGSLSFKFQEVPTRGQIFTDSRQNIYAVSKVREDVAELDKIKTFSEPQMGSELTKRGPLVFIGLGSGLNKVSLTAEMTTFLYPLSLILSADLGYKSLSAHALGGVRVNIPLSDVFEYKFTLIEDASCFVSVLGGVELGTLDFCTQWGLGYRHVVGKFWWEAGYNVNWKFSTEDETKDFSVSVGVML